MKSSMVFLVAGLACCVVAAHPAGAATGDKSLKGTYAQVGSNGCLWAPGGFNSENEPNTPASSFVNHGNLVGTRAFDGKGDGSGSSTQVSNTAVATPGNTALIPSATTSTTSGNFSYHVAADGTVTLTESNVTGSILDGPRAGQTFTIDQFELTGNLGSKGTALTLATPQAAVETITYSNGNSYPRICHREETLILIRP